MFNVAQNAEPVARQATILVAERKCPCPNSRHLQI